MKRMPGSFLLKVARFIFDDTVLSTVVAPTISDLQHELRDAGLDRGKRVRAAVRGYTAFWVLVLAAPIAFHKWPTRSIGHETADRNPGFAFALIVASIVLCAWSFLGWWTIVAAGGGVVFACLIHWWHGSHPTVLAVPEKGVWRAPEINQSRIPVDGNIAGLMYVVGSLVVALIGIPVARWFFFSTIALGLVCAVALLAWHNAHPRRLTSIIGLA